MCEIALIFFLAGTLLCLVVVVFELLARAADPQDARRPQPLRGAHADGAPVIERVEVLVRPERTIRIPAGGRAELRLRDDSERGEFEVFDREGHLLDRIPCIVENFAELAQRILQMRRAQCN